MLITIHKVDLLQRLPSNRNPTQTAQFTIFKIRVDNKKNPQSLTSTAAFRSKQSKKL